MDPGPDSATSPRLTRCRLAVRCRLRQRSRAQGNAMSSRERRAAPGATSLPYLTRDHGRARGDDGVREGTMECARAQGCASGAMECASGAMKYARGAMEVRESADGGRLGGAPELPPRRRPASVAGAPERARA